MAKTPSIPAKKDVKTPAAIGKKKRTKRTDSYSSYIYKVLKQIHPNTRISKSGMSILISIRSAIEFLWKPPPE